MLTLVSNPMYLQVFPFCQVFVALVLNNNYLSVIFVKLTLFLRFCKGRSIKCNPSSTNSLFQTHPPLTLNQSTRHTGQRILKSSALQHDNLINNGAWANSVKLWSQKKLQRSTNYATLLKLTIQISIME